MEFKMVLKSLNRINKMIDEGRIRRIFCDGYNRHFIIKIFELFGHKVDVIETYYMDTIKFESNDCLLLDDYINNYKKYDDLIKRAFISGSVIKILTEDIFLVGTLKDASNNVVGYEGNNNKKPPLGITPRFILEEKRRDEIISAMNRYINENKKIPESWIIELNEIVERVERLGWRN